MRKIFTISVLSVLAVMGTASAAPDLYDGAGTLANLNVATVNYVDNAIAIAKPDTSGLVEKAQVVTSDGVDMNENPISGELTPDEIVPTVGMVEANFAPRIGDVVYSGAPGGMDSTVDEIGVTNLPRGEYSVIVSVDGSGKATFRWVPIQIDSCSATDGGTCGPV